MRPSDLLRLPAMGLSDAVCLDFDFAVRALKRWADRRADDTMQVPDTTPQAERKRRMKTVPRFTTLAAVLGLTGDDETPEDVAAISDLAAQMLTVTHEWGGLTQ